MGMSSWIPGSVEMTHSTAPGSSDFTSRAASTMGNGHSFPDVSMVRVGSGAAVGFIPTPFSRSPFLPKGAWMLRGRSPHLRGGDGARGERSVRPIARNEEIGWPVGHFAAEHQTGGCLVDEESLRWFMGTAVRPFTSGAVTHEARELDRGAGGRV